MRLKNNSNTSTEQWIPICTMNSVITLDRTWKATTMTTKVYTDKPINKMIQMYGYICRFVVKYQIYTCS